MNVRLPWRLPGRLFASYALVAVVGAAVSYVTVRLLAPRLFDRRMGMMGDGSHMTGRGPDVHSAFLSAVNTALVVGVLASVVVAAALAMLVTQRLLRPLDAVRAATRRIAAGHYDSNVPLPSEPELAELASDVNALADALAATESRRTRLLGEVAHEMRTPLTSLDGYVEGMIDGVFAADQATLASLSTELRRLHRLADDLSDLSRTEERRLELSRSDEDLTEIVRRAAARLAPQFQDAQVALEVAAAPVVSVHVDPDRITQVLTNLLGNALLATPPGGVVSVRTRCSAARAEVEITDTGVGLAGDDVERVFERFYRAPGQPRRSGGSGIGLTIARGIARAHGGDVTAASAGPGHGATFTVSLPRRD